MVQKAEECVHVSVFLSPALPRHWLPPPLVPPPLRPQAQRLAVQWRQGAPAKPPGAVQEAEGQRRQTRRHPQHLHTPGVQGEPGREPQGVGGRKGGVSGGNDEQRQTPSGEGEPVVVFWAVVGSEWTHTCDYLLTEVLAVMIGQRGFNIGLNYLVIVIKYLVPFWKACNDDDDDNDDNDNNTAAHADPG